MSIIVTGAAGFIGSTAAGAEPARRDRHHRGGRSHRRRAVPQPGGRRYRRLPGPERLPRALRPRRLRHGPRAVPPGRLRQHPGKQWPLHDGEQLPLQLPPAGKQPGTRRAVPLRLVGGGLRRRPDLPRGAPVRAAAERLRLFQVPSTSVCGGRCARAARWSACVTSTSTGRARNTRGGWPRWPTTATSNCAATGGSNCSANTVASRPAATATSSRWRTWRGSTCISSIIRSVRESSTWQRPGADLQRGRPGGDQ